MQINSFTIEDTINCFLNKYYKKGKYINNILMIIHKKFRFRKKDSFTLFEVPNHKNTIKVLSNAINMLLNKYNFNESTLFKVKQILLNKNNDYGNNNLEYFGIIGIVIRLCDKLNRLRNLENKSSNVLNETIEDTVLDAIGYCILGIIVC